MLNALRRRNGQRQAAGALVEKLTFRSRLPVFYEAFGVADTIDGRFDLLTLHAWLVLERVSEQKERGLAQRLVDGLFVQFDEALRQQGAGDIAMGRRMTKMADAFYGRMKAYGEAGDDEALSAAVLRNVFRGEASKLEEAKLLAIYASSVRARLKTADLSAGEIDFGPIKSP